MNRENSVFGEMEFQTGWKIQGEIVFFEKKYPIVIKGKSYRQEDGLTSEQRMAMELYAKDGQKQLAISQQVLSREYPDAQGRFTPTMLLFQRDGEYALLLDDAKNPDEGISVVLSPTRKIVSQDDYL